MAIFSKVVETGSFTAAAHSLNLGKSVVSSHVSQLEETLGVQLLVRSTRAMQLTNEGRTFYESCKRIVDELSHSSEILANQQTQPSGQLKVSCSVNFGIAVLCDLIANFNALYPDIKIDLRLEDRFVDITGENYDLAIRTGWQDDSMIKSISLGSPRVVLCASKKLSQNLKQITEPKHLKTVPWIQTTLSSPNQKLRLKNQKGKIVQLSIKPSISTNAGLAAKSLLMAGAGVALLPEFAIHAELKSGKIVQLLPDWQEAGNRPISIVFANKIYLPKRLGLLVEFLGKHLKQNKIF